MSNTDITRLLERLESMEDRCGIGLDALYAQMEADEDDITVQVTGEIHSVNGGQIATSITLQIAAYDKSGRVIQTDSHWLDRDTFFGFDTFNMRFQVPTPEISKIRLFPKPD